MFKHLYKHTFVFTWSIAIFTNTVFLNREKNMNLDLEKTNTQF